MLYINSYSLARKAEFACEQENGITYSTGDRFRLIQDYVSWYSLGQLYNDLAQCFYIQSFQND